MLNIFEDLNKFDMLNTKVCHTILISCYITSKYAKYTFLYDL